MSATDMAPGGPERSAAPVVRRLAVTWQHPETRQISPVALLEFNGETYSFSYVKNAETVDGFRHLLGFPDMYRTYRSQHLFPLFAQRVMDPRRPDHARYVERLGLAADATPWEQMTRSGGAREGDTLQLFPEPERRADGSVSCSFLVHGVRHIPARPIVLHGHAVSVNPEELERRLSLLREGDDLRLIQEPDNPVNSAAVVTATSDSFPLGWVPDLLLHDLYEMSGADPESVRVVAQQVNGPEVPSHMRLLARLSTGPNSSYRPFTGPLWERLG